MTTTYVYGLLLHPTFYLLWVSVILALVDLHHDVKREYCCNSLFLYPGFRSLRCQLHQEFLFTFHALTSHLSREGPIPPQSHQVSLPPYLLYYPR